MADRHALTEAQLAAAWQERRYEPSALVDDQGRRLTVVYPGRRWGGPGPDFVGALLALPDGSLVRGDVEVHLAAAGWTRHAHAADPAYRNVVLHVVRVADGPTLDASGRSIPTLTLQPTRGRLPPPAEPCLRSAAIGPVVERAGRERFRARVARFEGDLAAVDADQVLWRGVAEALGYRHNAAAFACLADAVPWAEASAAAGGESARLAALLLGAAGLLDEAEPAEWAAWTRAEREVGARRLLAPGVWERTAVRPGNSPVRRCRGLAVLASRWRADAPERSPAKLVQEAVRQAATVRRPALWPLVRASPWIGRGRAQVVVINVLLPFARAAGVEEAAELFVRLPGEPPNRVLRHMARQLGGRERDFRSACGQQGLLHLFGSACAIRLCETCPAARSSWPRPMAGRRRLDAAPSPAHGLPAPRGGRG